MKLLEFLKRPCILADLKATSREQALSELAEVISRENQVAFSDVLKVLVDREKLGSTGIGDGVAIPHGTFNRLTRIAAVFARSRAGVPFDAIDGQPVQLFLVLLTPDSNQGLKALARVSQIMRREELRAALIDAADADALFRLLSEEDARI